MCYVAHDGVVNLSPLRQERFSSRFESEAKPNIAMIIETKLNFSKMTKRSLF